MHINEIHDWNDSVPFHSEVHPWAQLQQFLQTLDTLVLQRSGEYVKEEKHGLKKGIKLTWTLHTDSKSAFWCTISQYANPENVS